MALSSFASRRAVSTLLMALAVAFSLLSGVAHATSAPPLASSLPASTYCNINLPCLSPNCGSGDQSSNCGEAVTLHGGSVQHDPVVYLVFWGGEWSDQSNPNYPEFTAIISDVEGLFNSLAGTAYNNILTQYNDSQGALHNDVKLGGTWIDTVDSVPPLIGKTQFDNEVISIESRKWHGTPDTQFIIFPQQGSRLDSIYDTSCGRHDYANDSGYETAYSFVRYAPDWGGCDYFTNHAPSDDDELSMVTTAAHEYAEAATDPNGPLFFAQWGWSTTDPRTDPIEVADQCQGYNGSDETTDPYVSGTAPWLWDQSVSGCLPMRGQDFVSPDHTGPSFHGIHTVQGAILTTYQAFTGTLGQPLTEEMPLAGGRVSYFANQICSGGYVIPSNMGYGGSGLTSGSAILWTSSTGAHEVQGCIYHVYMIGYGGPGGALLFPVTDEQTITNGSITGKASYFSGQVYGGGFFINGQTSGSAIFSSSTTSTHAVKGYIYTEYMNNMSGAGGALSFPVTDEQGIAGGRVSYFYGQSCNGGGPNGSGSAIYYNGNVTPFANEVQGCIYHEYVSVMGGPGNPNGLGFPIWDEEGVGSGRVSWFSGQACNGGLSVHGYTAGSGIFFLNNTIGAHEVQGCIFYKYWHMPLGYNGQNQDGPGGALGFPTSDEHGVTSGYSGAAGRANTFQHGAIYYWSNGRGTFEVQGAIYNAYLNFQTALGFPISDEYTISGGRESDFENGFITWNSSTGQVSVTVYPPCC